MFNGLFLRSRARNFGVSLVETAGCGGLCSANPGNGTNIMRLSQLVGQRLKDAPRDAQSPSHIFIIRGGYARPLCTGIYSLLPLGKRVVAKVEKIIREEMDAVDGQEVLMPVVQPQELWEESGRAQTIGAELLRFKDRNAKPMVLAMTHEEAVCHLARTEITSYKQLPSMLYQIQTKYRDEARPRGGLIRVREFTMKDAYSFHATPECLAAYYERVHQAYENIFRRVGLKDCISIKSDTGMIGGKLAHEFMAVAECGEDTLFVSPDGRYKANREIAESRLVFERGEPLPLEEIHTPHAQKIEEIAAFLGTRLQDSGKCVCYATGDGQLVLAMVRGDSEINELKLKKAIGRGDIAFANDEQIRAAGGCPGYVSPYGLDCAKITVVFDHSVADSSNLVIGANKENYHYRNFNFSRDFDPTTCIVTDIRTVKEGEPCPVTGEPLIEKRGIEVGNIFQLGTRYSEKMGVNFLDQNGKAKPAVMGCYGIGVGRTMAAVIEQNHDQYGPIWPLSIAPFQVHLVALNYGQPEVKAAAEQLYAELQATGLEVIFDDRGEKAGFAFADADLIGAPLRLIVSPKSLPENKVEFKKRDWGKRSELIDKDTAVAEMKKLVQAEPK
ncbi:MAG: proline--tRNA ligase [bacterium]